MKRALITITNVILTSIYKALFYDESYGFRPGRGAHQTLNALVISIERRKVSWIVDCDTRKFFDAGRRLDYAQ